MVAPGAAAAHRWRQDRQEGKGRRRQDDISYSLGQRKALFPLLLRWPGLAINLVDHFFAASETAHIEAVIAEVEIEALFFAAALCLPLSPAN